MSTLKKFAALLAAALCISMAGCGGQTSGVTQENSEAAQSVASSAVQGAAPEPSSTSSVPESSEAKSPSINLQNSFDEQKEATLYIGMRPDPSHPLPFDTYPLRYSGELTPELLIQGISELTWWDLTLADEVTTGKGGMTVCFADTCGLISGPPSPQNEEFFTFGVEEFSQTILDSIQKTLQMNFTGAGGDPDNLDIYYCMSGNRPVTIAPLGYSWPIDQPYHWENAAISDPYANDAQADGADSAIIAYLRENLSAELGDLSRAEFSSDADQVINGDTCRVFNITVNRGNGNEPLGTYAVVSGLSGIYKFNVQTAEYEEYAKG